MRVLVGHGLCLDTHFTILFKGSLLFVLCWRCLTVIFFVTPTFDSIVTCYMYVVNFEGHKLSSFLRTYSFD
jgi:hypothetical protein